jgi:CRISPR-associated protein Csb2
MIALRLRFPTGRYHATPWGRHVNEGAVAWPPEPLRILRALVACHYRKADRARFTDDSLAELIDSLALQLPIYRLPEAVQAHTRHYMPAPPKPTLVFDTFARFDSREPLIVGWPGAALTRELRAHLEHLAVCLGYLGRAESWVECEVIDWDGKCANAQPLHGQDKAEPLTASCHSLRALFAPLSPREYSEQRARLIHKDSTRHGREQKDFLATLPSRLVCALAVDTSKLHRVGWSDPPAAKREVYLVPELMDAWRGEKQHRGTQEQPRPTVARFMVAGRPRPRVEDTVRVAEIMRGAAMARFGWSDTEGKRRPNAPSVISGYGGDGKPLRGSCHGHAFWLPEDADRDGEIDHVVVYAATGFDASCCSKLGDLTRLWIQKRRFDDNEPDEEGREEWRLALEGFGRPRDFASVSALFGSSKTWVSATPYLMPWHAKKRLGWAAQIARELHERGLPNLAGCPREVPLNIHGRERRPIHFHRFRSRRGLRQPDTLGRFLELTFEEPLEGPLSLGFGCHFGLGLFRRRDGLGLGS